MGTSGVWQKFPLAVWAVVVYGVLLARPALAQTGTTPTAADLEAGIVESPPTPESTPSPARDGDHQPVDAGRRPWAAGPQGHLPGGAECSRRNSTCPYTP